MIVRQKRKGKSMFFFDFFDFSDLIYLILFKNTISNKWQQFPKALYCAVAAVLTATCTGYNYPTHAFPHTLVASESASLKLSGCDNACSSDTKAVSYRRYQLLSKLHRFNLQLDFSACHTSLNNICNFCKPRVKRCLCP